MQANGRAAEAVDILLAQLGGGAEADDLASRTAARLLGFDFSKNLAGTEARIWSWLLGRALWEHTEERLLWRMLERCPEAERGAWLDKAEAVALAAHPSRAKTLGWVLNRMGQAARSIPLLQYASAHLDEDQRASAQFALYESYLDSGDLVRAEILFPAALRQLTPDEIPTWHAKLAKLKEVEDMCCVVKNLSKLQPAKHKHPSA